MRKPLKSLVAATGAAFVMTAGFAAPALAAPASPDGTSQNVSIVRTPYTASHSYVLGGSETRNSGAWTCGEFRMDGWGPASPAWRLAVGTEYAQPDGVTITMPTSGEGWTMNTWAGAFPGFGSAEHPTYVRLDSLSSPEHPDGFTYMADQSTRVMVTNLGATVNIQTGPLAAGEYFNATFPVTYADGVTTGDTLSNSATIQQACETPAPSTDPTTDPSTGPTTQPTHPVRPAPDKDKHIKKVNSGGVEEGGSGLIALGLGAAALGGLAVYGRRRSNR
ncbi:hypothetical protein AADG42_13285 [Ammonicoccus fulvus]|uniref:Gram-positive cocci surface proteins LPxTG domain-containing protein n=1 Tax=Ammonicoccus fulvus TaxID=3138240 RepID=A0ABZ3FQ94_9ACTN